MSNYEEFKKLHYSGKPLVIANVWDAISVKAAEKAGFKIAGASSHPIADMLGYKDGQNISFDEVLYITKRIKSASSLLLSLDFEAGYTDDLDELNTYVEQLVDAGVSGINLEDGITNGENRKIADVSVLESKIKSIKSYLKSKNKNIFINARIDTYTTKHPEAFNETLNRAQIYEAAGADGVFVPLIEDDHEIRTLLETVNITLNVFLTPNLHDYKKIESLGIHRVSSGNKTQAKVIQNTDSIFEAVNQHKFGELF